MCKTCKRPFSSCPKPLFQSEAMCEATDMKMRFCLMHWNKTLRVLPFVQTERPAPSRRNENFTFNQNYPAKSVKYWIVCTKKMVFPQKLLKRPFHFQTDWSGNGAAGQFWQMDWAPLASFWKREFLELGNCLCLHSFILKYHSKWHIRKQLFSGGTLLWTRWRERGFKYFALHLHTVLQ